MTFGGKYYFRCKVLASDLWSRQPHMWISLCGFRCRCGFLLATKSYLGVTFGKAWCILYEVPLTLFCLADISMSILFGERYLASQRMKACEELHFNIMFCYLYDISLISQCYTKT